MRKHASSISCSPIVRRPWRATVLKQLARPVDRFRCAMQTGVPSHARAPSSQHHERERLSFRWREQRRLSAYRIGCWWQLKLSEVDDCVCEGGTNVHNEQAQEE
jgi:hypothetical protein